MKVAGYDYPAFVRAIAERDGPSCHVHRVLVARREAVIARWRESDFHRVEADRCAGWIPGEALGCDGELEGHHLLKKTWLKSWHAEQRREADWGYAEPPPPLADLLNDPRNGILTDRRHHDLLENARIKLTAGELPACVFEFAAELGDRATGRLWRDYEMTQHDEQETR